MDNKLIGIYLQNKRKEKGLTQKDLADIIGVTFQAVSRWEKGDSIPDLDSLDRLADFYEVSIDTILQRKVVESNPSEIDLPENFEYVITFIVSITYLIGGILMAILIDIPSLNNSWGYLANILAIISGLFLHNMFYFVNTKTATFKKWYFITYIPFIVALIFFVLIDSGIIV